MAQPTFIIILIHPNPNKRDRMPDRSVARWVKYPQQTEPPYCRYTRLSLYVISMAVRGRSDIDSLWSCQSKFVWFYTRQLFSAHCLVYLRSNFVSPLAMSPWIHAYRSGSQGYRQLHAYMEILDCDWSVGMHHISFGLAVSLVPHVTLGKAGLWTAAMSSSYGSHWSTIALVHLLAVASLTLPGKVLS